MKQAYLIMAHKCDETFFTLLHMLDYEKNDIFIHMDKKNKQFNPNSILLKKSSVYFSDKRINVRWGGYSQIEAELILLEKALLTGKYGHYHLLSGEDLPIKSQEEIYKFFNENADKEFVAFDNIEFKAYERVRYFYFFQDIIGRDPHLILRGLNKISIGIQKGMHIQRNYNQKFLKGANWFSISDEFARYVLSLKKWIRRTFRYTKCCDEIFLQTICINSKFKKRLFYNGFDDDYKAIMRLIDWKRGEPYVFREDDMEELLNSDKLFARKFQSNVDIKIIQKLSRKFSCLCPEDGKPK